MSNKNVKEFLQAVKGTIEKYGDVEGSYRPGVHVFEGKGPGRTSVLQLDEPELSAVPKHIQTYFTSTEGRAKLVEDLRAGKLDAYLKSGAELDDELTDLPGVPWPGKIELEYQGLYSLKNIPAAVTAWSDEDTDQYTIALPGGKKIALSRSAFRALFESVQ